MSTEQIRRVGRWSCRRVGEKSEAVFARVSFPFPSWKTEHVLPIPRGVISAGAPAETIYAGSECNKNTDFHGIWRQSRQKPNFSLDSGGDIDFLLIALGQNVQMYWLRLLKASGSFQTAAVVCFDQGPTHARVLFVLFFKFPQCKLLFGGCPKLRVCCICGVSWNEMFRERGGKNGHKMEPWKPRTFETTKKQWH